MKIFSHAKLSKAGFTLMEIILSLVLLAIFGLFVMEFLTTAWLSSEKETSRAKCVVAAENIIQYANAWGVHSWKEGSDETIENAFARIINDDFSSLMPPVVDVATFSAIKKDSIAHPDHIGNFLVKIATDSVQPGNYTVYVGDAFLANLVEVRSFYATQPFTIDFNQEL